MNIKKPITPFFKTQAFNKKNKASFVSSFIVPLFKKQKALSPPPSFTPSSIFKKRRNIMQSALGMSAGTTISRILGLVRDMAIGAMFSRTATDAFFVAFRLPNFFRRFLGESALSISFIPIFIQCLKSNTTHPQSYIRAKNFMNSVYTILLVVITTLTVLGVLFMDTLLQKLLTGTPFTSVVGKMSMTVTMARLLFLYLFFVTVYAYFMGIANALGRFFMPALAPAFLNVCIIISAFLPQSIVPFPSLLLCVGVLSGGLIQVLLTAITLYRLNFLPHFTLKWAKSDLWFFINRFLPGLLGSGGFAIIGLLNLYFSAWLKEGTHTFIYYGDRLLELPRSLIAISLSTALLPSLSCLSAENKKQQLLDVSAKHRDLLLFLILPCALGFWYLGLPIVNVLFQRGYFDTHTSQQTALVLHIYAVLLVTSSLSRVLVTSFYAVKNTWYPALACMLYVIFHWFGASFMTHTYQLEGLVWATVFSNMFFLILLLIAHPFYIGSLYVSRTVKKLLWSMPALLLLAVYLHYSFKTFFAFQTPFLGYQTISLFGVIISSIVLYIGSAFYLRLPQALECVGLIQQKFHKKITKNKS